MLLPAQDLNNASNLTPYCRAGREPGAMTDHTIWDSGLYGRSPDRSARVCNLCENGDYIQDENVNHFHVWAPNIYGHQFNHLFNNISEGDIKGFVFQHNSEVY